LKAAELLAAARARGVDLWPDGNLLRFRGPRGAVTPDLREALQTHKPEVLSLLRGRGVRIEQPSCSECGRTDWIASVVTISATSTRACS
jgi:hypothetical protein